MTTKEEKRDLKARIKAKKEERARKIAEIREDKKQLKEDAQYLNSFSRVIYRFIWCIVEYILMFIILSLVIDFVKNGSIDVNNLPQTISEYMKPGSVLFTALVSFLPVMILANVGVYFGLGSIPRMVFGIAKTLAVLVWFNLVFAAAGDIDILKMSGLQGSSALQGLLGFSVNVSPLVMLVDIILLLCCIIPVGEFIGCRRKHNDAVATHEAHKAKLQADKDALAADEDADKQEKIDAKEAKKHASEKPTGKDDAEAATAADTPSEQPTANGGSTTGQEAQSAEKPTGENAAETTPAVETPSEQPAAKPEAQGTETPENNPAPEKKS